MAFELTMPAGRRREGGDVTGNIHEPRFQKAESGEASGSAPPLRHPACPLDVTHARG